MYGAMDIMMTGNSMDKLLLIFISEKVLTRIVLKSNHGIWGDFAKWTPDYFCKLNAHIEESFIALCQFESYFYKSPRDVVTLFLAIVHRR